MHQSDLDAVVKEAGALLGPDVVHLAYRIGPDSTDAPSIFFRILLADAAVHEDTITAVELSRERQFEKRSVFGFVFR